MFLHKTPYTPRILKKLLLSVAELIATFTFLLLFTVDEVCNISNKYQTPSN